jgi:hypothetical protein
MCTALCKVGNEKHRAIPILSHIGVVKEGENQNTKAKTLIEHART